MKKKGLEYYIKDEPTDYISSIKFHEKYNHLLLVSSWDCYVRLYDVDENSLRTKWETSDPNLASAYLDAAYIAFGGVSGMLKVHDVATRAEETIGSHTDALKFIEYVPNRNVIVTGSWDQTVKVWDRRQRGVVGTYGQCGGKVYSMSVVDEKIAVGTSGMKALIWDLRNMSSYMIRHKLNHPLNCIALSPNKECYVVGTVDGRATVYYIDKTPETRKLKHTFKCHRMIEGEYEHVYSITAIRHFNEGSIFATGGGNGFVNVWNGVKKAHVGRFPRHEMAVAALDFNCSRTKLAVACAEQTIKAFKFEPVDVSIKVWYVNDQKIEESELPEQSELSEQSELPQQSEC